MHKLSTFVSVFVLSAAVVACRPSSSTQTPNANPSASAQPADERWVKGSATSTVTLIEYSDFECPACASYYWLLKQVTQDMGDRVRFSYRHFPLRQSHRNAQLAAQAAEAAGLQGKFWDMHDRLFETHDTWANKDDARQRFLSYAGELGLDVERFRTDFDSRAVADAVEADFQRGLDAGVRVTPTFYLNGRDIDHPTSVEEFRQVLQAELAGTP